MASEFDVAASFVDPAEEVLDDMLHAEEQGRAPGRRGAATHVLAPQLPDVPPQMHPLTTALDLDASFVDPAEEVLNETMRAEDQVRRHKP